ncbi:peroxidase 46 [Cornus florida]|uniref:peroxidase 46 n=1 Tax=Cornus florida TaxID=4283 RepID=UPI00289631F0|nr:peroxidase 46 [Cornus florida]
MEQKLVILFNNPTSHLCNLVLLLLVMLLSTPSSSSSFDLSLNFYAASCPTAEMMVKNTVRSASSFDPTLPGKLLRLLFHDCFVQGCDASVLIQGNGTERSDPANASLGGYSVIDSAKRVLEIFCPGVVSCADILALAARDAVQLTGGPAVEIPTGRRDGMVSEVSNVRPNIVDTSFTLDEMINIFSSKGLSVDDLVILSGAHTIGSAHCSAFSDRFKADSTGNLSLIDATLDGQYAAQLTKQCPVGASASVTVNNDPDTPQLFDNQYYKDLLAHKGLFQSDSVLANDARTRTKVVDLANDQGIFFQSWAQSFLKLVSIEVKTGDEGQIRQSCSVTNSG